MAPTLEALATGGATGREEDTSWGAPFLGKLGKLSHSKFFWDGLKKAWLNRNKCAKPPLAQRALQSWYPQSWHSCTNMAGKFTFHGLAEIQPTIVTALCLRWNEMNVNCNYIDSSKQTVSPWINYACLVLLRTISNLLQSLIERHINSSRNKCTLASRHRRRDLIERFCGPAIEGVSWLINSLIESVNEWKSEPLDKFELNHSSWLNDPSIGKVKLLIHCIVNPSLSVRVWLQLFNDTENWVSWLRSPGSIVRELSFELIMDFVSKQVVSNLGRRHSLSPWANGFRKSLVSYLVST